MARGTFTGGVHPYDGKDLSRHMPIKTVYPRGIVVFPLLQHMGAPAIPCVKVGDPVLTGQMIAKADGDFSANIHSSVSGMVVAIRDCETVGEKQEKCIVISNDDRFSEIPYPPVRKFGNLTPIAIESAVRGAGVVGMGGAGLPTHIKLSYEHPDEIDYCIANCVECEPYLTSDYRRIVENPAKVLNGLRILLKVFPKARGIIALDESMQDVYSELRRYTAGDHRIYVKKLESKFPQGSERQLIYALTGRTMNSKMLPSDIGCIVNNVDTLVAVNQAVMLYEPLLTRLITVSGDCIARPRNYRVRIGMSYAELIERAGGFSSRPALILDGGTMTGKRITNLNVPITKLSSGIIALSKDRAAAMKETACSRCGRCVEICPDKLLPITIYNDALKGDKTSFIKHHGLECCNCVCCSYICPSKIDLADKINNMKREILANPDEAGDYSRRLSYREQN